MLHCEDIKFDYQNRPLLNGVSFSLKQGEIATLVGSSGAGKTSLFQIVTALLKPLSGSITINGKSLPSGALFVSYMMQQDLLLPWRTVLDNLLLIGELGKKPLHSAIKDEALELLKLMGLESAQTLFPHQLSQGMRQRVSLARALLQKRPLLLLDEPFSALDVKLREQMYQLLKAINEKLKTTILLITHDFHDALTLSDRILSLKGGKIVKDWYVKDKSPAASSLLKEEIRTII